MQFLAWNEASLDEAGSLEIKYVFTAIQELNKLYSEYAEYLQQKEAIKQKHKAKHGPST